jgi:hypothetical protein
MLREFRVAIHRGYISQMKYMVMLQDKMRTKLQCKAWSSFESVEEFKYLGSTLTY